MTYQSSHRSLPASVVPALLSTILVCVLIGAKPDASSDNPAFVPAADSLALVALYNATDGANWTNNTNWLTGPVHTWFGITTSSGNLSVTGIILTNNNLVGPIPTEIGDLADLRSLWLDNNGVTGSIPSEIGNLSLLENVRLSGNELSGAIPPEIGDTNMKEFSAASNDLSGSIPPEFGDLTGLTGLQLNGNDLSGAIPIELTTLTNLVGLRLNGNELSGSIPPQIGNLTNLRELLLGSNNFTGQIPVEMGNLVNIDQALDLSFNSLSGPIPTELGNLTSLTGLVLRNNQLTGSIPVELTTLTNLHTLQLSSNDLTGPIPNGIGNLTALNTLWLSNNALDSTLPPELGNLINLTTLQLDRNNFVGSIPVEFGNFAAMLVLTLNSNNLVGAVPASFTNLASLVTLHLHNNDVSDLPDLSGLPLNDLRVHGNSLLFDDLEPHVGINTFIYTGQTPTYGAPSNAAVFEGAEIVLEAPMGGANNVYQWRKDGVDIPGATNAGLTISSAEFSDAGNYTLIVFNTLVTGISYESAPITLSVDPPPAIADLEVTKTVDVSDPAIGSTINFVVTVTNNGPADATGIEVLDAQPANLVFDSSTPSQGAYATGTGIWDIGSLSSGSAATLSISATVTGGSNAGSGEFVDLFADVATPFGLGVRPLFATIGPDGNLFVSARFNNAVFRFDGATGAFIDEFVSANAGGLDTPQGIAFGDDGNLYVASATDEVLRYDGANGDFIDVFATSPELIDPNEIVFGPDGNLYVAAGRVSLPEPAVIRFDGSSGAFIDVFAIGPEMRYPPDLAFGPDGNLYVVSTNNNQVVRYDATTGALVDIFVSNIPEAANGIGPAGLTFGPDDNLYVTTAYNNSIRRYDGTTGDFIDVFASELPAPQPDGLTEPYDMFFGPDGLLYVVNVSTGVIRFGGFVANVARIVSMDQIDSDISNNDASVAIFPGGYGTLSGIVTQTGAPVEGVIVELMDDVGQPLVEFDDQVTNSLGAYEFDSVATGNYQVSVVEPLGYSVDVNPQTLTVQAGDTTYVDFELTPFVIANNARSRAYWKHQFRVHVRGRGHAHESVGDLMTYISEVETRYTSPYYQTIFAGMADGVDDFEEWHALLKIRWHSNMEERARAQLGALVLNVMSLKIAQYEVVTDDGRDAGDVITYVSDLVLNGDPGDDQLARKLARRVNRHKMIDAGVVPDSGILYKTGDESLPEDYAFDVASAYPNPFADATTIEYTTPGETSVRVQVFDVLGRVVGRIDSDAVPRGRHSVSVSSRRLALGAYFVQITTQFGTQTVSIAIVE